LLLVLVVPDCITEIREFLGGNSSSYLGFSFQQMHEGLCICFRLILQAQSFVLFWSWYSSCFEVKCGFPTFPKRCSHISMGVLILLINRDCHENYFPTGVLLFKSIRSFRYLQDQFSVFLNGVRFNRPKLPLFFPPSHPFSSRSQRSQIKYPFYS
jgi:hypothetical protein